MKTHLVLANILRKETPLDLLVYLRLKSKTLRKLYHQSLLIHQRSEGKRLSQGGMSPNLLGCSLLSHLHPLGATKREIRIGIEKKKEITEKVSMMRRTLQTMLIPQHSGISVESLSRRGESPNSLSKKVKPLKELILWLQRTQIRILRAIQR